MNHFAKLILVTLLIPQLIFAESLDTKQELWIQDRLETKDLVGLVVVSINGDVIKLHTYGKRSVDDPRPPSLTSQFEIGSISKVFTNLLLAEMVAKGTLSYTTSLADLLPQIKLENPAIAQITLLELGTHTSGLPRLPANLLMSDPADPYLGYDAKDLLEAVQNARPDQKLIKVVSYSNFGVGLLGYLLGEADNSSYFEALQKHVLKPLGMNTLTNADTGLLLPGHSAGKIVPNWHIDALAGAGVLRSNATELSRLFTPWLSANSKLTHDTAADLKVVAISDKQLSVTSTWMVLGEGDETVYWHNGGTGGYSSFAGFNPTTLEGWIVLSNSNYNITAFALGLFATPPTQATEKPTAASQDYSEYYGYYAITADFVLTVFEQQGQLFVQATSQAPIRIAASGDDKFTLLSVDAQLVFERDASGTVVRTALHQNGQIMPAPRVPEDTSVKRFTEIKVDKESLNAYTGSYELAPGVVFKVKVEAGQLVLKLAEQPWVPVFAHAKDKFFYKVVDAQITFNRENGEVVSLTLHQNGANQVAPKH